MDGNDHIFIGIDPGLSGSIAVLNFEREVVGLIDAPTITYKKGKKNKKEYDIPKIVAFIRSFSPNPSACTAFLEKMQSLPPGIRIQATFSLGYAQGVYEGILAALRIPYHLVISRQWQRHFQITKPKGDTKAQSFQIAGRLFPSAELKGPRGGIKDGRCDALLIAEWGRAFMCGVCDA